jgi:hypothetical protein
LAFQCEPGGVGRMGVARGAAEAEHWIFFFRLKSGPADQARIFIGLKSDSRTMTGRG